MILQNAWYVAAWADELPEQTLLARTLLNERIVLWRSGGEAVALADRCSHRGLPLSLGRIKDGVLECGYHGVCFDANGACVKIPGQGLTSFARGVRSYPVTERYGFVWVWFGDPAGADSDALPDVHWANDPGWIAAKGRMLVKAGHELLIDNLNNDTHLQYVHSQVGAAGMAEGVKSVQRLGDQVEMNRWYLDLPAPPHFQQAGNFKGTVDRWAIGLFTPPTTVVLDVGCAPAGTGAPQGNRVGGVEFRSLHLITPESETTTHYFWVYARNFDLGNAALTDQVRTMAEATFLEDLAVLEAQQSSLSYNPDEPFMNIAADAAGIVVNRVREEIAERLTPAMAQA